ncbi:MAG: amino acid permease [Deinococcales bacterium]
MIPTRHLSFIGASSIGVGAIVGGGILALAGTAFAVAGPSAILAFALNGGIALLTALSFAELSVAYPSSGGSYTFAKRALNVRTAFVVGWIVCFASIVAAVLYALGFGVYAVILLKTLWANPPLWLLAGGERLFALFACIIYTILLLKPSRSEGDMATYGKVIVFALLILAGLWALAAKPLELKQNLSPFFTGGLGGLIQAMGFSFIALQGFDLIAAVAGEVKEPSRNLPRSMIVSLLIALAIYLPLLFVVMTVGVEAGSNGHDLMRLGQAEPEALIALAAKRYMGPLGYWLVVVAALLAMLSALRANLFAASRIAQTMAKDGTLPKQLARLNAQGIPVNGLFLSNFIIIIILFLMPNVAAAGAAASLIFLISFALVHGIAILARRRIEPTSLPFKLPLFPLIPSLGGLACMALAAFQGWVVPAAGGIALVWLVLGLGIYGLWLEPRARRTDAAAEILDPSLVQLRGRSPLILVPIANPDNAASLVSVASALIPAKVGRVLLLSVMPKNQVLSPALANTQKVLAKALEASANLKLYPEALTTLADDPWQEMARVAKSHGCESLLLGVNQLSDEVAEGRLSQLFDNLDCDIILLRLPSNWNFTGLKRIIIPIAGGSQHDVLRARLLASLAKEGSYELEFVRVLSEDVTEASATRALRALEQIATEEAWGNAKAKIIQSSNPLEEIIKLASSQDLIVLGSAKRSRPKTKGVGKNIDQGLSIGLFAKAIVQHAPCAVAVISRHED